MKRPSRRALLGFGILAVWLGVAATHIKREYFKPPAARLALGARTLAPGTEFYVVRMGGAAIGFASSRLDTLSTGFTFDDQLTLDVPAMGERHRVTTRTRLELSPSLELERFDFALDSEAGRYEIRGEIQDSVLALAVDAGGEPEHFRMPVREEVILAAAMPLRLAAAGELREGRTHRVRVFDPSTLDGRDVEVQIGERATIVVPDSAIYDRSSRRWSVGSLDTLQVWRVDEHFAGVRVTSWIDEDGRVVRAESPVGLMIERTAYELARQEWEDARDDGALAAGYGAIIESTAIASRGATVGAADTDRLAVRLLGVDLDGFDLAGGRQALRGDTLVVERESAAALQPGRAGYRLPYTGGGEAAEWLESTPLVQATDPRVVERARRIADGEDDPAVVARKINDWVHGALEKRITPSMPSAVQVLETLRGDCNEHTVLYVALARAAGLPARTAVGLVHIEGRYYYHAWPEVWLDGWVALDPTFGQAPADATHLRFLVGGLARQVELIRLLGRLELEAVAVDGNDGEEAG